MLHYLNATRDSRRVSAPPLPAFHDLQISPTLEKSLPAALLPEKLRVHDPVELNTCKANAIEAADSLEYPISRHLVSLWNGGVLGVLAVAFLHGGLTGVSEMASALLGPQMLAVAIIGASAAIESRRHGS